jgi:hypothetical protein
MLEWFFEQTNIDVWISTIPKTRIDKFYRKAGWTETGYGENEIKFEITFAKWLKPI